MASVVTRWQALAPEPKSVLRIVAALLFLQSVLSGEMAVAYFQFHFPNGFWPIVNQGQPAVLFCFIWLYFSAAGAGPWSLDAALRRSS